MIELGKFLIGSQNYNLAGPNSDKDYKIIVCPSFEDFVWRDNMRSFRINEHETQWDVRHWFKQLLRGNPNAIEIFYSTESQIYDCQLFDILKPIIPSILREHYGQDMINMWYGIACKCGETQDHYKGLARKYYFTNVFAHLTAHNMEMSEDTWRSEEVSVIPRKIRFEHITPEERNFDDIITAAGEIKPLPEDVLNVEAAHIAFLTCVKELINR